MTIEKNRNKNESAGLPDDLDESPNTAYDTQPTGGASAYEAGNTPRNSAGRRMTDSDGGNFDDDFDDYLTEKTSAGQNDFVSAKYYNKEENKEQKSNKFYNRAVRETEPALDIKSLNKFPTPVIVVIIYLLSGFFFDFWHPGWLLFLTIPLYYQFLSVFSTNNLKKRLHRLPVPVLCVFLFLFIGVTAGVWHPTWMLFLLIPIYYMLVSTFFGKKK